MDMCKQQKGVTVVELMVALVLGIILMGGVLQIYLSTKQTFNVTESLSRLQESTRYSLDMMARDIRMAGYIPCGRPQTIANVVNAGANDWWAPVFDNPLLGFEGDAGINTFPDAIKDDAAAGSDAIIILRGGNQVAGVNFLNNASNQFILQRDLGSNWVEQGSLMVACDPRHAAFFQAGALGTASTTLVSISNSTANEKPSNCTTNLGPAGAGVCNFPAYTFGNDAQIANYNPVIYFVAQSVSGEGFSLFKEFVNIEGTDNEVASDREELLEGVESMQLLYGVDGDLDGFAERYFQANAVAAADWPNVVSVRIGLLLASEDDARDPFDVDTQTYRVANTVIGPASGGGTVTHAEDRRKRYVSSTTVSVRNPNI